MLIPFSEEDRDVIRQLRLGSDFVTIASYLGITKDRVYTIINRLKKRMGAHTTAQLIDKLYQFGVISVIHGKVLQPHEALAVAKAFNEIEHIRKFILVILDHVNTKPITVEFNSKENITIKVTDFKNSTSENIIQKSLHLTSYDTPALKAFLEEM